MKTLNEIKKIAALTFATAGLAGLALPTPAAAQEGADLVHLCVKLDARSETGFRNNGKIVLRTACAQGREQSLGTLGDLALLANKRTALEAMSRVDKDGDPGNGNETVRFTGVNVQVVSGSGGTNRSSGMTDYRVPEGLGNLIVGYDEATVPSDEKRVARKTGSHNLIVGRGHEYTSFAGFISGNKNTVSHIGGSISGGESNTVSGQFGSVSGGEYNNATGYWSSVLGGRDNLAFGHGSVVLGRMFNTAQHNNSIVPQPVWAEDVE